MINVAINGFGRIGRCFLRAFYEKKLYKKINLKYINGTANSEKCSHFVKYDSVHGRFENDINFGNDWIDIGFGKIQILNQLDINTIAWDNIDVVIECSGKFNKRDLLQKHIDGGAKKILVSAPCDDGDSTIIFGVNNEFYKDEHKIVSVGSCTTNALLPLIKVLNNKFGIKNGYFTTIHSYTNDQMILDANNKDLRRARAGALSMIPTSTGASKLIASIFPELNKKISGSAVRVPTPNVSMIDLVFNLKENTSSDFVRSIFLEASKNSSGIIGYTEKPLVSVDFLHTSESTFIDGLEISVVDDNLCRVVSWYDNEWGFVSRMLDVLENLLMKK
jgi:glyceraldehyde 3-phosphate dehydrogenase